jgi:hypothetical protein
VNQLVAAEQLTERGQARLGAGDPTGEVAAAWQGKELLRAVYAADGMAAARAALERIYRWAAGVQVPELSRLAGHRQAWGPRSWPSMPPMAAPMGRPTEAVNLLIKRVERVGYRFRKAMASLLKLAIATLRPATLVNRARRR